eukprot:Em0001g239a
MAVKDFKLELNVTSGQAVFVGEVSGTVVFSTDQPRSFNAITISLKGCADVAFQTVYVSRVFPNFSHDDYINEAVVLWNQEQIPNRVLDPGHHTFPFRFSLTGRTLPSSYETIWGRIKYVIEARIVTAPNTPQYDKIISKTIQVVDTVDINIPDIMVPVQREEQIRTSFLCFTSTSPVSLTVTLPRTGFCLGEGISFTASVNNGSPYSVTLEAVVTRTDTYRAGGQTDVNRNPFQRLGQSPPIPARSTFQWIPPADQCTVTTATPTIANSGSISLEYNLAISLHVSVGSGYGLITIPIVLGNVPPRSPVGPLKPPQYPPLPTHPRYNEMLAQRNQMIAALQQNRNSGPYAVQGQFSGQYQAPPPGQQQGQYQAPPSGQQQGQYQAPPPGQQQGQYQAPPPGQQLGQYQAPPPGQQQGQYQAPPLGQQLGQYQAPPPYEPPSKSHEATGPQYEKS